VRFKGKSSYRGVKKPTSSEKRRGQQSRQGERRLNNLLTSNTQETVIPRTCDPRKKLKEKIIRLGRKARAKKGGSGRRVCRKREMGAGGGAGKILNRSCGDCDFGGGSERGRKTRFTASLEGEARCLAWRERGDNPDD